jgi:hypothetical protein
MKTRRSATLAFALLLVMPVALHADDFRVAEVFAGYSLFQGDLQNHASGWEVSGGGYLKQWLSLHADFDAHHQSSAGNQRHQHDFLFGPQFSHRTDRFTLFAHTLAGGCHTSGTLSDQTGFAAVTGGGIDWDISPTIGLRVAQVDYHAAHLFGTFQNDARFSFGIVFHLVEFRDPARPAPPPPDKKPFQTLITLISQFQVYPFHNGLRIFSPTFTPSAPSQ